MFENIFVVMGLGWVGAQLAAPDVSVAMVFGLEPLIASACGLLVLSVHRPANTRALGVIAVATHLVALALYPWIGGSPWGALQTTDTWTQARHCAMAAAFVTLAFAPYALSVPDKGGPPVRLMLRAIMLWAIAVLLALELHCALPAMEYRWFGHATVPALLVMAISLETHRPWRSHVLFYVGLAAAMALCFYGVRHATKEGTVALLPKSPAQKEALRAKLTPEQYACTQDNGTETPFHNAYWDNYADGIYVDVVSGEPLFSSLDKFDSKTGWPSFTHPIEDNIVERKDTSLGAVRTEVRSGHADSHLGHVFDDGPAPTGQRYCINSASLRFVALDAMHKQGYDPYLFAFADKMGWDIATLAGGCFWGMQEILAQRPGVIASQVGYTGGLFAHPTYDDVSTGTTGHAESLQILFDPKKTPYDSLLLFFFRMHDPTTKDRQVNDIGTQYRSAIFYRGEEQKRVANAVLAQVNASGAWHKPLTTEVSALGVFWRAEDEHQNYLDKHPYGYTCHEVRDLDFRVKP